jgi:hypothetical protein
MEKKEDFGEDGKLKEASRQYALSYLLQQCTGSKDEKSNLEHLATKLSGRDTTMSILFTPKYHCELAGEGIEYYWGAAKQMYRKLPSIKKSLGSPSGRVLLCTSAKSTSRCADNFRGGREVICLVIITKPWKRKTEEKKSRVLSEMKKFRRSIDPTGMHSPFLVNSSHR